MRPPSPRNRTASAACTALAWRPNAPVTTPGHGGISRSSPHSVLSPIAPGLSWSRCDRRWHNGKASSVGVRGEDTRMYQKRLWIGVLLGAAVLLHSPWALAVESDPLPGTKGLPGEQ